MRKFFHAVSTLGIAVVLAGCIQTKDEYTLNPDGTGKVIHEANLNSGMNFDMNPDTKTKPDKAAQLTNAVRQELQMATGIDAWKDITFSSVPGGTKFKATAYFTDLSKVKFHNGGFQSKNLHPSWKRDGENMVLELTGMDTQKPTPPGAEPVAPATTAKEAEQIVEEKAEYEKVKPMLAGMLGTMNLQQKFHLPGPAQKVSNLKTEAPDTVAITLDGKKMVEVLDSVMADDKWWHEQINAVKTQAKNSAAERMMNEKMFGQNADIRATVAAGKPLTPLFDYASETAAAKKAFPANLKAGSVHATE